MKFSFAVIAGTVIAAGGLGGSLVVSGPAFAAASPAGSAPASTAGITSANLIMDPGAERAKPISGGGVVKVPGWKPAKGSMFTAVAWGDPDGFPGSGSPGPKSRGKNFFAGGPSGNTSGASQVDSLTKYEKPISKGRATFKLSGWLGGYSSQTDRATLTVTWETAKGKVLGHATIGPVTAAQRKDVTGLLLRAKSGKIPSGARKAAVALHMVRDDGEYVDGYADNLSLTITS